MSEHLIETGNQRFKLLRCYLCAIEFLVPYGFYQTRKDGPQKQTFWCPNGHDQIFTKTEADRLQEQLRECSSQRDQYRQSYQRAAKTNNELLNKLDRLTQRRKKKR